MSDYESTLERVRGLLAKAASTEFPAEADTLRAKADELMTKYAIEEWEIERAQRKASSVAIKKDLDLSWYWETKEQDLSSLLYQLFCDIMHHCRVEMVTEYATYRTKSVPVVGMPSDISYADVLFTHLMNQVIQEMDPHPVAGDTLEMALARMKESGMKWEDIYRRLRDAGLQEDFGPWGKSVASKVNYAGVYTRFCELTARKRLRVTPSVHRRSFIYGFNDAMRDRFRSMREDQGQYTGSMAIALREYRQAVKEAVWVHFPELKPHAEDCQCDVCTQQAAARANVKVRKGRKRKAAQRTVKVNVSSMDQGASAASRVKLIDRTGAADPRIAGQLGSVVKKDELG